MPGIAVIEVTKRSVGLNTQLSAEVGQNSVLAGGSWEFLDVKDFGVSRCYILTLAHLIRCSLIQADRELYW